MQKRLAEAFRAVDAGTAYRWASARPAPQPPRAQVLLVDKPDAAQTYFRIGHAGIHRTHPGRIPILLINTLFGGRFTSMLNDALRVESGLTYGASSLVNEDRLPGAILISTFTRTETTAQAIDMALNLLRQLREKGITADQLASAKAYVKGTFPPRQLETATQLAAVLGELELYNLGREEIDEFFPRIDAVSLEQANAAAGKHFAPGPLHFVLLGNAAEIRKPAARYAADIVEVPITKPGIAVAP
jgi:zinc protease